MGGGEDGLLLAQIALGGVCGLLLRRSRFLEFTSSCCADRAWFPEVPPGHIRSARGLDSASLHLARGASPYGKRQSPSRLCASTTRLGDCLLPHCSLPIRTVYHNPPQKPMNFFLLLPVLPPPLPSLHSFSPPFHPFTSHFPPFLSTFLPSAPHFSILLTLSPFSLHHFTPTAHFPLSSPPSYPILSLLFFPFSTSSSYLFPSHSRFPSLLFLHPSFSPSLHLPPFPPLPPPPSSHFFPFPRTFPPLFSHILPSFHHSPPPPPISSLSSPPSSCHFPFLHTFPISPFLTFPRLSPHTTYPLPVPTTSSHFCHQPHMDFKISVSYNEPRKQTTAARPTVFNKKGENLL